MTEPESTMQLAGVASEAHAAVGQFVVDMQERLGHDLASITVVGSGTGPDFKSGVSDINTILVLTRVERSHLEVISQMAKGLRKRHMALPLLMTPEYIERSRDVFGVELLDFQLSGKTVLGENPFDGLTFERSDVRLQCERELKAMLIRLRQGYMASAGNARMLRDVLVSTGKTLLPYLRAMVWLNQGERDNSIQGTLSQARETLAIETSTLELLLQWRNTKVKAPKEALVAGFDATYAMIVKLADWVDSHEV
ncbi:MAG: hypothetical protein HQ515_00505 [Phycisphaeraceae bacterium]|nr:hypothetical protein [Phycisphaeraceae bacterium]